MLAATLGCFTKKFSVLKLQKYSTNGFVNQLFYADVHRQLQNEHNCLIRVGEVSRNTGRNLRLISFSKHHPKWVHKSCRVILYGDNREPARVSSFRQAALFVLTMVIDDTRLMI